jgi:sigma-B regulation protein RsbU (phosphoserine phosphatase)
MLASFAGFLAGAITLTVTAMAWNAKNNLIEQVERDVSLLARVLSKTVSVSRTLPDQVEAIAAHGMIATASALAEWVAVAERHGEPVTALRSSLKRIIDNTAVSEIWITDSRGRAYLNAPLEGVDFTFSPNKAEQPQASQFWPLLTGEKQSVVQPVIKREIDDRHFKYAGVSGIDQPRIVQVGVRGDEMRAIRESVGLDRLAGLLVGDGALKAMVVVDPDLSTIVSQRSYEAIGEPVNSRQRDILASVIRNNRLFTEIRPHAIQVYHPIRDEAGASLGGFMVQLPREGIDQLLEDQVRSAVLIGVVVFLLGGYVAFGFARRLSQPIAQVTRVAANLQRGDFSTLDRLAAPAQRTDEIGRLAQVFREMAEEVRNREQVLDSLVAVRTAELADKNQALEAAQALINSELDLARRLQLAILPASFPALAGCNGFARMLPATHMGGDFYDFVSLPDGRVALVVADVSGKGVAAAFFMAVARTSINSLVRDHADDPGRCLSNANQEICAQNPLELFVTVFLGVYDPGNGQLRYANAGHNPPMIRVADSDVRELPSDRELALGVIDPVDYQTRSVSLAEGDQLVLYTDGVTEAFNAAADMYGESRLRDLLAAPDRIDAASRVEQVFADVVAFAAGHPQSDDITVAVLNITSGN